MARRWLLCLLIILTPMISAKANTEITKIDISILGGINYVQKQGSLADYKPGINDFPIMPAHISKCFGAAFSIYVLRFMGLEFNIMYNLRSKISVTDPSDGETIRINSADNMDLAANLFLQYSFRRIKFYIIGGLGSNLLVNIKDEIYYTQDGSEITVYAPEKTEDALINAGGGIKLYFTSNFGIKIDARYIKILAKPTVNRVNIIGGLIVSF